VVELSGFEADARSAVRALTRSSRILERSLQGLSLADFRVLSAVAEGEARASRLAQRLALGKPAISSTVESLVRRGLLRRESHHADQRATDLVLTDAGSAARSAAESELVAVVTSLVADTPDPGGTLAALAALDVAVERRQVALASARRAATGARPGSAAQVAEEDSSAAGTSVAGAAPAPAPAAGPAPAGTSVVSAGSASAPAAGPAPAGTSVVSAGSASAPAGTAAAGTFAASAASPAAPAASAPAGTSAAGTAQVAAPTPRAIPTAASAPVPRPADTSAPSPEAAGDAASDPVRLNAEFGGKVML
jgi:DNA-binding MarR family transcriptional regulator